MRSTRAVRNRHDTAELPRLWLPVPPPVSRCGMRPSAATCSTVNPQAQRAPCGSQATRRGSCGAVPGSRPASARSRVDLPAPFGPHSATSSPGAAVRADVVQHRAAAERHGHGATGRSWRRPPRDHHQERRAEQRRQHADRRGGRQRQHQRRQPHQHVGRQQQRRTGQRRGRQQRAGRSPSQGRSRCGTTRPTKPIDPATAAPAPTASAVPAAASRKVRVTGTPRLSAVSSPRLSASSPRPERSRIAHAEQDRPARPARPARAVGPPARPSARR